MRKITPFLWYNNQALEAAEFYVSLFKNSKLGQIKRFGPGGPAPEGTVMTVNFEIEGQEMVALNGGPMYSFTPAISFFVDCVDQAEVDRLWEKLADGGEILACGWIKDRFGLCWQIVPSILGKLLDDPDRQKAGRVMGAMMKMKKLDVNQLQQAAKG